MKKLYIAFLLGLIIVQAGAVSGAELTGKVINTFGEPIAGASIYLAGEERVGITVEDGKFSFQLQEQNEVTLTVHHPYYLVKTVVIKEKQFADQITIRLIPLIRQKEEIVVTATRYPEKSLFVPAGETVISAEQLEEKASVNIETALTGTVGVSSIGSGGFSKVPSIRGLARKRILLLIDNARINGDRRTGPNASFINPDDIGAIEVLRSPSSVFYGSDAIGGVIHVITKKPLLARGISGEARMKYGFNNKEKQAGISLNAGYEQDGFYFSAQGIDADNYHSPSREIPVSYFSSYSLFSKYMHSNDERDIELSYLLSRGIDIGKPTVSSYTDPTWYPHEDHNLLSMRWHEKSIGGGQMTVNVFINPNSLDTQKDTLAEHKTKETFSVTKSIDFGVQLAYVKNLSNSLRITSGMDFNGRAGVLAENTERKFDEGGAVISEEISRSYEDGKRNDYGLFVSLDYTGIENFDISAGVRWDYFRLSGVTSSTVSTNIHTSDTMTGYAGISYKVTEDLVVFGNCARAYRLPDLSERYYTGITGRGMVIGNPDLKPETSINYDFGIRFARKAFYAGLYVFRYRIDDLVERYLKEPRVYTYGNIEKGLIKGLEFELEYYPIKELKLFANTIAYSGKSEATDTYLNDIPSIRFLGGVRFWKKFSWVEASITHQQAHTKPGPAEIAMPSYTILNIMAGTQIHAAWSLNLTIINATNKEYIARPDPDALEEPGRSVSLALHYKWQ